MVRHAHHKQLWHAYAENEKLSPREESNFYYKLRKLVSYPLNDEGNMSVGARLSYGDVTNFTNLSSFQLSLLLISRALFLARS